MTAEEHRLAPVDHSQSYKGLSVRSLGHRHRLRTILGTVRSLADRHGIQSICDMGCSNGFITVQLKHVTGCTRVLGVDHSDNVILARERYPEIRFQQENLNDRLRLAESWDLVTCFETLEHVGDLRAAAENVVNNSRRFALISVPIEHGTIGFLKYLIKRVIFRYSLAEIDVRDGPYLRSLLNGERISRYRPSGRSGFSTHFGFDYRDLDDLLATMPVKVTSWNRLASRFYLIERLDVPG